MPVMYNQATRSARLTTVLEQIDAASPIKANLVVGDGIPPAIGTILATMELNDPSFTVTGDTLNLVTTSPVETGATGAAAAGTASSAQILDGSNTVVVFGLTVGTTAAEEIQLNSTAISVGQTVTVTNGTITHAHAGTSPT